MRLSAIALVSVVLVGVGCATILPHAPSHNLHPYWLSAHRAGLEEIRSDPSCALIFSLSLHATFGPNVDLEEFLEQVKVVGRPVLRMELSSYQALGASRRDLQLIELNNWYAERTSRLVLLHVVVHEYAHLAGMDDARLAEAACFGRIRSASP